MKWHQRFFWLLLLFLPTQLGFHFWPDWAHVLGRRVDYLAPTIYLTDILLFATLFFWFFESFFRIRNPSFTRISAGRQESGIRRYIKRIKITFSTIIHTSRFMILFLGFAVINIWIAKNQQVAIYKWLKAVEFILLGWYIVRTKPKLSSLSFPLAAGVFYSSVLAIAQFMLQHSIGGPLWWLGERTFGVDTPGIARIALNWSLGFGSWDFGLKLRPYATFPHPNVLGGFLAVVLPLIALRYLSILGNLKKKTKFFYGSVLAVGVIALLLTFSRSAIIVGGLAMVVAFFFRRKFLLLFFVLAIVFSLFTFHFSLFTSFEESVVVRQQLNIAAIKLWQSSPLFGVGLGNFLARLPETLPTRTIYFLQPVHNIYLLVLVEVGVVGSIFFLWLLWCAIESQKSKAKQAGRARNSNSSLLTLSLLTLLLLGLVDHYPLTLQQGQMLLAILAGFTLQKVREVRNVRKVREGTK